MKSKLALFVLSLVFGTSAFAQSSTNVQTPQQAIIELQAGNERFISGNSIYPNQCMERVESLKKSQAPFAAIVTCSDSRVPAELLFDNGFGEIFVIRTAGNSVVDASTQGSVDYAINHLGVKLVVVMGHTNCGAIKAVVTSPICDGNHSHDENEGELPVLIEKIANCIPQYKGKEDSFNEAIEANVAAQTAKIAAQPYLQSKVANGELQIVSALYDLKTGKVNFKN